MSCCGSTPAPTPSRRRTRATPTSGGCGRASASPRARFSSPASSPTAPTRRAPGARRRDHRQVREHRRPRERHRRQRLRLLVTSHHRARSPPHRRVGRSSPPWQKAPASPPSSSGHRAAGRNGGHTRPAPTPHPPHPATTPPPVNPPGPRPAPRSRLYAYRLPKTLHSVRAGVGHGAPTQGHAGLSAASVLPAPRGGAAAGRRAGSAMRVVRRHVLQRDGDAPRQAVPREAERLEVVEPPQIRWDVSRQGVAAQV